MLFLVPPLSALEGFAAPAQRAAGALSVADGLPPFIFAAKYLQMRGFSSEMRPLKLITLRLVVPHIRTTFKGHSYHYSPFFGCG